MKKNVSLILASLIVVAFVGFFSYYAYQQAHPKLPSKFDTLKVAYQEDEITNLVSIDLADAKGYFKQNGLIIDRKTGLKNISTFVLSGQVDISQSALAASLAGFYTNQDLQLLAITERYPASMKIVSRYPEDKLSQVKNIAIDRPGGTLQNMFSVVSKNLGLNTASVNYVVSADAQGTVTLLNKGTVDLAFISNYDAYKSIQSKGNLYTISLDKAYNNVDIPMGIVSTSKTINQKSGDLKKYVASIKESIDYFSSPFHHAEMINFIVSKYGYTKEDAEAAYDTIIDSTGGVKFTADESMLKDIIQSVKTVNKPTSPNRDIQQFIAQSFK